MLAKKSHCASLQRKWKEKSFFFFFVFTLSDSISRSIGISGVKHHEISPILGFQRNSILKPPQIWPYYVLHLRTDYTIMWQLQRWNCGDGMFPTLVNWFLTSLWTETIEQITNDSTRGINSFCNLLIFSCWKLRADKEKKNTQPGFWSLSDLLNIFTTRYTCEGFEKYYII